MGELISLDLYRARRQPKRRMRFAIQRLADDTTCCICGRTLHAYTFAWQGTLRGALQAACPTPGGDCFSSALQTWMEASRG